MSSLVSMKIKSDAKEQEENLKTERKKGILVLIQRYLIDNGYFSAGEKLQQESGCSLNSYDSADNMDLYQIIQQFEEYYFMKFQKRPKLFKKLGNIAADASGIAKNGAASKKPASTTLTTTAAGNSYKPNIKKLDTGGIGQIPNDSLPSASSTSSNAPSSASQTSQKAIKKEKDKDTKEKDKNPETTPNLIDISGTKIQVNSKIEKKAPQPIQKPIRIDIEDPPTASQPSPQDADAEFFDNRLLPPLPDELFFGDYKELAEIIKNDIIVSDPGVYWEDIAGLGPAKQLVKEAIVLPMKYPQLFTGILSPWRGVLLFGPPGTGKTMLAKAVATECRTTFFNISASSIVSKWRGDSEKLVRVLFTMAHHYAPSTIFIDELDSVMSRRSGEESGGGEHEGSRRLKTELLIQMDGLNNSASGTNKSHIFVIGASNLPWDLDMAILRRLEKRIMVPLPDVEARERIFRNLLPDDTPEPIAENLNYSALSKATEGYSGADLVLLCKESAMRPLRKVLNALESQIPSKKKNSDASDMTRALLLESVDLKLKAAVTMKDVGQGMKHTKPSTNQANIERYEKWMQKYGNSLSIFNDDEDEIENEQK